MNLRRIAVLLLLTVTIGSTAFAQQEVLVQNKRVTASEIFLLLERQRNAPSIVFRNCDIVYSESDDDFRFAFDDYGNSERASGYSDLIAKTRVDAEIRFETCRFNAEVNRSVIFSNWYFRGGIVFDNCKGYGVEFDRCVLWDGLSTYDLDMRYLTLERCQFYHSVSFNDNDIAQVKVSQCDFVRNDNAIALGFDFTNRNVIYDFNFQDCQFLDQTSIFENRKENPDSVILKKNLLYFNNFDAVHFTIENSVFDCTPVWGNFSVERTFVLRENTFRNKVVFSQTPNIPVDGSVILFSDLVDESMKTRIGILQEINGETNRFYRYDKDWEYAKDQMRPWVDASPEKQIIPVYSKLLAIYNATADVESYNLCFRQMKKIEKTASKVRWETRANFLDWFRWKMDIFLESFSAYGTDPVLSLFNSFYVICIFGLIYMIFPSETDNLSLDRLQKAVEKYIAHFAENQKQFFSADELFKKEKRDAKRVRELLEENAEKLPPVVSSFSAPFYYLSQVFIYLRHQFRVIVYFDVYQDWSKLTASGKFKTSVIISLHMLGFLLWGVIMRVVNGLTLSLNAFVTLGYGGMEAKGLSRYLCIVEGLIGWFLLSIFSVSLISQILQ